MASTTNMDKSLLGYAVQGRTDISGVDVVDASGAELRLNAAFWGEGVLNNSFAVAPDSGMNLTVGADGDVAVLAGSSAGQGQYLVGTATDFTVTVPASDPSQARVDEVYLVVLDNTYDASGLALPIIGYRTGTVGGGAPGPDSGWTASLKLATVNVGAGVTTISINDITDERVGSEPAAHAHDWADITGKPATFTPSTHSHGDADINGLDASAVTTGSFAAARIPSLDASKIGSGTVSAARLPDASTSAQGVVQLSTSTSSTSTSTAATPSAVKAAYDLAASKANSSHTHAYISSTTPQNTASNSFAAYRIRNIWIGSSTPSSTGRETGDVWFDTSA